jgi:Resolvase, N terminal domain
MPSAAVGPTISGAPADAQPPGDSVTHQRGATRPITCGTRDSASEIDRLPTRFANYDPKVMVLRKARCHVRFRNAAVQHQHPGGPLTLHILLSFAQFEREIISERTRDKKAGMCVCEQELRNLTKALAAYCRQALRYDAQDPFSYFHLAGVYRDRAR